ncbi:hypothetical protein QOZ80_4AG0322340 [Eleusine coracana subsp. coracana]|nr:hypothetical protein QOZ80_4AG0322340 [Eleusine coracana subsp. coracana]
MMDDAEKSRLMRLHHPPLPRDGSKAQNAAEQEQPSWVLLELKAYVADRENSTSACSVMSDGLPIRVTLCAAPPPVVSYLCIWCPDQNPDETPHIKRCIVDSADADLAFLYVCHRSVIRDAPCDCFVYKASNGGRGPVLRPFKFPDPSSMSSHYEIVLLPHGPHDGDFVVALLKFNYKSGGEAKQHEYELCVYHSTDGPARFLPLSEELITDNSFNEDMPLLYRDIALVEGTLTVLDLCDIGELDTDLNRQVWEASIWSRKVTDDLWEEDWSQDYVVHSSDVTVMDATDNVELLPKVVDDAGAVRPTLELPYMAHPTLSLSDSHVVYVMGKLGYLDKKVLVMAVDMKEQRLQAQ